MAGEAGREAEGGGDCGGVRGCWGGGVSFVRWMRSRFMVVHRVGEEV